MAVMLSVSAPLAFAVPDEERQALKDLCKQINRYAALIIRVEGVDEYGVPTGTPFTDQGECIEYVNTGGEIFALAAP